jgi:hypothetical protein
LIAYGPDNTRATKLVATIVRSANPQEENVLHRWLINEGEIRNDSAIAAEIADFFKQHGVTKTATYDRILGCPHEEGIDYPMGRTCPRCPFWANLGRTARSGWQRLYALRGVGPPSALELIDVISGLEQTSNPPA